MNAQEIIAKADRGEGLTEEEIRVYREAVKPVKHTYGKYGTLAKKYLEEENVGKYWAIENLPEYLHGIDRHADELYESMYAKLSRIGITIDDLRALTAIGSVGIDRAVLANRLRSPRSQTIRRVRPLEKLGWVQCTEEGHFQLTHSGRSLVDDAISLTDDAAEKWLLERLPPEQIAQLRTLLIPVAEPL